MSLLSRLRERQAAKVATATPATFATQAGGERRAVASVATVTVAKFPQQQAAIPAKVSSGDMATGSRWWLIHYRDRDPVETAFDPAVTHAELLKWNRDVVAAEPLALATASLPSEAKATIRRWLALIGEVDPDAIDRFLALSDGETHRWVLEQLTRMR